MTFTEWFDREYRIDVMGGHVKYQRTSVPNLMHAAWKAAEANKPAEQTAQQDREADQAEFHKLWGVCTFNGCHEYNAAKSFWIAALEYARKK